MTTILGPRIGVALGGGSARGLVHIAFIEAMDELGLRPSVIAGSSIGALIGAGWAAGMKGRDIREHAIDSLGTVRSLSSRLWLNKLKDFRRLFREGLSVQLDPMDVVQAFLPPGFLEDFHQLRTPLYVVATDFHSWHQVVFHSGPLRPALAGSIAIPSLFRPVRFGHTLLVDGSVVNPLPLDAAAVDTDILVGIDVNGEPGDRLWERLPSPLESALGSAQIMLHALTAHHLAAYPPDIYIRPHIKPFGAYEFWRVREIIAAGERDKERFKRLLARKLDAFIGAQERSVAAARQPALR